ncbi:hypothetical protein LR48_Vigan07g150600 [Vigna angularis]|uniref:Ubiquitin-like protease family profile domain-containing protein n=1 Tax=Phaseolus angularis TaxID=3914 RepID=A0A0L9UYY4_PHAAN|nr:hypothetical protein LR48_Vigan07g150600 [Vigna angularis]
MILHLFIYTVSQGKRLAAQERQRLNDAPHLLSRGGYAKLEKKLRKSRADALGLESSDLAPAPARKAPLELYWDLRVFGLPPHMPVYITLSNALEMIGGDRMLNISIIQLWYMDTIVVEQGRSSMYGFVEPQTIQPSGNTLQNRQHYLQTWMDESKRDVYLMPYIDGVIGKSRGQLVQILYPKCNQQLDSWECGFYVMCWIKTIIRAVITDDWNERFKSTSPILEDTIRQIRQEWTAYLLQRWNAILQSFAAETEETPKDAPLAKIDCGKSIID